MKKLRKIIRIDEELCTGCGECIRGCAEGALALVDGKAKLISEVYCDGLGACIGTCPAGALTIVEDEAPDFDEEKAKEHLGRKEAPAAAPCQCPSAKQMELRVEVAAKEGDAASHAASHAASRLAHWPVKLQLLNPLSEFLKGSRLLLLADCAALAYPNLHRDFVEGHVVALMCPKFSDLEEQVEKLAEIIDVARISSLTVLHMEVPCCHGLHYAALSALEKSTHKVDIERVIISREGEVKKREIRHAD
ncbi:MAG: ATP-binding protein [Vulcanimicrobiota bacterium]